MSSLVGGKGANLGEMSRARLPVPPGFCVTAPGYRHFLETTGLDRTIREILDDTQIDDPVDVEVKSAAIRASIIAEQVPAAIAAEVVENYSKLGEFSGHGKRRIYRWPCGRSATAEDLPSASFAGQQDTYLNISRRRSPCRARPALLGLWMDRPGGYLPLQAGF